MTALLIISGLSHAEPEVRRQEPKNCRLIIIFITDGKNDPALET